VAGAGVGAVSVGSLQFCAGVIVAGGLWLCVRRRSGAVGLEWLGQYAGEVRGKMTLPHPGLVLFVVVVSQIVIVIDELPLVLIFIRCVFIICHYSCENSKADTVP
jgi:hypothetical protein